MLNSERTESVVTVAIIPARAGSKRIPHKNLLKVESDYALGVTIKELENSGAVSDIFVSTDSEEIARVALEYGARVPFRRTGELSGDFTTTTEVVVDAIDRLGLEPHQELICSYPLAMLSAERIKEFALAFQKDMFLVTIGQLRVPPARILSRTEEGLFSMSNSQALDARTQDLDTGFFDAGKLYMATADRWLQSRNMLAGQFSGFLLSTQEAVDVDTLSDWDDFLRYRAAGAQNS